MTEPRAEAAEDTSSEKEEEAPAVWRIKKAGGVIDGPFTALELVARHEAGLIGPKDLVSFEDGPFVALSTFAETAAFVKAPAARRVTAFASSDRRRPSSRMVWAVAAVVLGALAGAFVYTVRPEFLFGSPVAPADRGAMDIVKRWREREPRPIASAEELFQLGRGYAQADTKEGARRALESYRRAIMRDHRHLGAVAAYAELKGLQAIEEDDADGVRESAELLGYALRHGGHLAAPHVARANILSLTGTGTDLLVAQNEAQQARTIDGKDPEVLLAVGRAFLSSNPPYALEAIETAMKAERMERRALLVLGEAYLKLGRIAEARETFEKRVALVPEDPTPVLRLAELDVSTGRFEAARRRLALALEAHPTSVDLRLLHAMLAAQVDGDLEAAQRDLDVLGELKLDKRRQERVAVHAAAIAEFQGRFEDAEKTVRAVLEQVPDSAALNFRLAHVLLATGRADEALEAARKAGEMMQDRALFALLVGRIEAARGRIDEAQASFSRAGLLAPHRAPSYLLAAAMYAQVGAQSQALALVKKGLNADPGWDRSHAVPTDFPERSNGVELAVGAFEALASMQEDAALTLGALAMARYHAGDADGAEKAARRALSGSQPALVAQLYLAQVLLDRRRPMEALALLQAARRVDRHNVLGHYLAGRALAQLGRFDGAHARYSDALDADPNFLPAMVRDAEALAQLGRTEEALALYRKVYDRDSNDIHVRRGLEALLQGQVPASLDGTLAVQAEP